MKYRILAMLFTALILNCESNASPQKKSKKKGISPRFLIVQLNCEINKQEAMAKKGRYAEMERVKADAEAIMTATINDFKDHFTYCPVYFYIDTNIDHVKAQEFQGILFDTARKPVTNVPFGPGSNDYLIAWYGHPVVQGFGQKVVRDSTHYMYDGGEPNGKGLSIYNYRFQQISYFYKLGWWHFFMNKNKHKGYFYESKHYDMEYYPFARQLNEHIPTIYE